MKELVSSIPIILVILLYFARTVELSAKRDIIRGRVKENLSFILFAAVGVVMFFGAIVEYVLSGSKVSWPFIIGGMSVSAFSIWLRHRAIQALGKFWSLHVEIREEHRFIQSGPFGWVRHPTYFSMILELISVALILKAAVMGIVIFLFFIPALYYRLKLEEAALIAKFGDEYREYSTNVPALFPYKLPQRIR